MGYKTGIAQALREQVWPLLESGKVKPVIHQVFPAAKAALNQLVRTAAVELARSHKGAIVVALHPGTVGTALSAPFAKTSLAVQEPAVAAARLLAVIDGLTPSESGLLIDHLGAVVPF